MNKCFLQYRVQGSVLILFLLSLLGCGAAQFVDLTVEIEINNWDHWFFMDKKEVARTPGEPHSIFSRPATVHCVVGTNLWMMGGNFYQNAKVTWRFTGTNILEYGLTTTDVPVRPSPGDIVGVSPGVGQEFTRTYETVDGNPGRPIRVRDLMEFQGRVCWLALCSGPALKREGRQIFPPSDIWKELVYAPKGFKDNTTVYNDDLGLPRSIELLTPRDQIAFQYQVRQSTNILGWNFPLEFYGVQYVSGGTNRWVLDYTVKGKVTSIGIASERQIPRMP